MSLSLINGTIGHLKCFIKETEILSQTKNKIASQKGDFD
jgi:hypothetical protein